MQSDSSADAVKAEELCVTGDDEGLLTFAEDFWSRQGPFAPGAAEIARYARLAAYRSRPADDQTWQARAVEAACLNGTWGSLALSLRQYFDRLVGSGDLDAAESVLRVMEMIASVGTVGLPDQDFVTGILAERRAVLLAERRDWTSAAEWFSKALDLGPKGGRRESKVKGNMARASWLAGGATEDAVRAFEALANASNAWPDVHEWAESNLNAARAGDTSRSVPFDLL